MQERRRKYEQDRQSTEDILATGDAKARTIAQNTMEQVRDAMKLSHQLATPGAISARQK
jgi:hypothetical protein